jgi:3-hydroxyacyl-CoA dehydrogenase
MEVKKEVFATLQAHTRPDAILATNTSYLDVNEIAATLDDPSRVVGLHFFSPAHVMKLLEIVLPDAVADDVVATAAALSKRLGKIGVLAGVCDGFIGNRIMSAYRREADYLVEDGALPWEVDAAMRDFGFPMGVFEMQDLAGLDIAWAMRKRRAATRNPAERYVEIADRLCEAGRLGRKTGQGWYDYADGKPRPSPLVEDVIVRERERKGLVPIRLSPAAIMDRILSTMIAEGERVVAEGIARSTDVVDVVMVNGYGFPRWRGGPFFTAASGRAGGNGPSSRNMPDLR